MRVICPHSLRGQCAGHISEDEVCPHFKLHEPIKTSGFTCATSTGVCEDASDHYRGRTVEVECLHVRDERIEEFKRGIEL